jgi:hypothetical protein
MDNLQPIIKGVVVDVRSYYASGEIQALRQYIIGNEHQKKLNNISRKLNNLRRK